MEGPLFNFGIMALAALVPMIIGFIWYHKAVFGKAWMAASGMTDEKAKGGNMPVIFGLSYVLPIFSHGAFRCRYSPKRTILIISK
jgi:hypothetical protein